MREVFCPMKCNPSQSWILDSRHWTPDSLSVELGFPISIGSKIPDSLNCTVDSLNCIPDFKATGTHHSISTADFPDSGFHGQKFPKFRNPDSLTRGTWSDCVPKQSQSAIRHNIHAVSREPHNGQVGLNKVDHWPVCPNKLWQSVIITEDLTFEHLMPKLWQCQLVVVVGCVWTRFPKNKIIGGKNIWQPARYHICSLIPPILKIQTSTCAIIGLI